MKHWPNDAITKSKVQSLVATSTLVVKGFSGYTDFKLWTFYFSQAALS